jgi:hypothetical protein
VHKVSDVRQIDRHTDELLVHDPNLFEVEIAIEKLTASDKIPAEMIQAAGDQ